MSNAQYYTDDTLTLLLGDAAAVMSNMAAGSVDCIVTSPPYYALRDYGNAGQIGLEDTPDAYLTRLVEVFTEAHRVLADDGTLWLNIDDSYGSSTESRTRGTDSTGVPRASRRRDKAPVAAPRRANPGRRKSLTMLPERLMLRLLDAGWVLRNRIAWVKTNSMPESVQDRMARRHEPIFLLTKSERYHFDLDAIRVAARGTGKTWGERKAAGAPSRHGLDGGAREAVPSLAAHELGANPGDVWEMPTRPFKAAHFAVFPLDLPTKCITAGCKPGGVVLDPFSGAGTTALAAQRLGRRAIGIDINAEYHDIALKRMADAPLPFDSEASA